MLVIFSFGVCLLIIAGIGTLASRVATNNTADYLLAGRNLPPWLAAFSSAATNNSGYMFVGLIGYTYSQGIEAVWLQMGWILGDVLSWLFVHRRIRHTAEVADSLSVPTWLGSTLTHRRVQPTIRLTAALTFLFLSGYAAAQLKAGSLGLSVVFGWDESWGILIGTAIVVLYCFAGGFRASVWTDAAQSLIMLCSMLMLLIYAWVRLGGLPELWSNLAAQDPGLVQLTPGKSLTWATLFVTGYVFGGAAALGQPHILSRTMAIRSNQEFRAARWFYFLWIVPFSVMTLLVGLFARAILPDLLDRVGARGGLLSAEHALPALSLELLPAALVGVTLAGLFSATMSTADSQVLTCSAAITQDLFPRWSRSYWASKVATLVVAALALGLALYASQGVFKMVLMAWSVLGSTVGPLVILRAFNVIPTARVALPMTLVGLSACVGWNLWGPTAILYEIVPGMLSSFAVFGLLYGALGSQRALAQ